MTGLVKTEFRLKGRPEREESAVSMSTPLGHAQRREADAKQAWEDAKAELKTKNEKIETATRAGTEEDKVLADLWISQLPAIRMEVERAEAEYNRLKKRCEELEDLEATASKPPPDEVESLSAVFENFRRELREIKSKIETMNTGGSGATIRELFNTQNRDSQTVFSDAHKRFGKKTHCWLTGLRKECFTARARQRELTYAHVISRKGFRSGRGREFLSDVEAFDFDPKADTIDPDAENVLVLPKVLHEYYDNYFWTFVPMTTEDVAAYFKRGGEDNPFPNPKRAVNSRKFAFLSKKRDDAEVFGSEWTFLRVRFLQEFSAQFPDKTVGIRAGAPVKVSDYQGLMLRIPGSVEIERKSHPIHVSTRALLLQSCFAHAAHRLPFPRVRSVSITKERLELIESRIPPYDED